jgi:hypothetical protein
MTNSLFQTKDKAAGFANSLNKMNFKDKIMIHVIDDSKN